MSGNNSADGCALIDNDPVGTTGFGYADYALCVTWNKDRQLASTTRYACNDTRADRCAGADTLNGVTNSVCAVDLANDDPFSQGASFPYDTKAYCSIDLTEVGGTSIARLMDVCSYPSQQPNSDPSDCVATPSDKHTYNWRRMSTQKTP